MWDNLAFGLEVSAPQHGIYPRHSDRLVGGNGGSFDMYLCKPGLRVMGFGARGFWYDYDAFISGAF